METNFHKNLLTSHNQNPRDFWKTVNHLREKDKHIETGVNPKELLSHLQNLNMKRSNERNEPPNASRVCVPHLDREISVAEVEEVLHKLKVNKAPGEDGIPPGVFKALDNTLIEMLAILFNNVMRSGEYPNCWSTGIICPLHKSGPRDDPNNYRGITLLNVMGKLFTAILCDRITQWATARQLLPETQFGFRKNRRTTDCLFIVNTLIERASCEKSTLFLCYVDFRKAFDSVDHYCLWKKLVQLGISQQTLTILQSMYSKAMSSLKLSNHEVTDQFRCEVGVRQGCNLSPLLFSLFISGLEAELAKNKMGTRLWNRPIDLLMYADDIVLMSSSEEGLRKHLRSLEEFCEEWKLEVNIDKTKVCAFGKKPRLLSPFSFEGINLEMVQEYKYLGVWLSTNHVYNKAKKAQANQGKKAIFALQRLLVKLKYPPITIALKLFDVMILPVLSYGCELWGHVVDPELEASEMHFLKYILNLPPSATNMAVRGELGQLPLHLLWREKILCYWNRLCSEEIPDLLREAFHLSTWMHQTGKTTWVTKVKELFDKAGMSFAFTPQGCGRREIEQVMIRYRDQFIQLWNSELSRQTSKRGEAGNKLRTYRLFKSRFELESYLSQVKVAKYRIALTKLRVSCHRLQIELGRYHKPCSIPPEQRLCKSCNCIEDEVHFVCVCPVYNDLRDELYTIIVKSNPSFMYLSTRDKFIRLLTSKNTAVVNSLAKFVHLAFKLHSSYFIDL